MINDASLVMIPSGYKDGKLYSVKPTDGSGDFTFSRGSNLAATRVNSEGLIEKGRENRLLQSNQFDTTWSKAGNLTSGQAGYDGTNDAWKIESSSIGQETRVRQSQTFTTGEVISLSVYMKKGNVNFGIVRTYAISGGGRAWFDLENGTVATENSGINGSIEDVGNGWYRCSIWGVINTTGSVDIAPAPDDNDYLSDAVGEFIYIQDAQLEAGLVATDYIETTTTTAKAGILEDMPRLNYGTCPSLLLEPQRTNLFTHSEYFGGYSVNNGTATANEIISPQGISNGYKFTENTGTSAHYIDTTSISVTSGNDYVISVFGKYDGRFLTIQGSSSIISSNYATFNLETGVVEQENIGDASIEDYGNGWYRCIFKITATGTGSGVITILLNDSATGGRSRSYTGDGTSGIYLYGLQIESGSYPTSYIPCYGAATTRSQDYNLLSSASSIIGQNEGTAFIEFEIDRTINGTTRAITISDGGGNQRIGISLSTSVIYAFIVDGGVTQAEITKSTSPSGTYKAAIAYRLNDVVFYLNGEQVGTDTAATMPTTNEIELGNQFGASELGGGIKQAALFKTRLTNGELAALTS